MRSLLLLTTLVALPLSAFAQSHCALPAPVAAAAIAPIPLPPPITVGGPPVPLMPTAAPQLGPTLQSPAPAAPVKASVSAAGSGSTSVVAAADIQALPALAHIAAAGATLSDLGMSHGLRGVYARHGDQVMVFEVAPDGQAAVAGLMTDLSVDQLKTMGGGTVTELPQQHGLRTLFLHNGAQFQVFYASPDNERLIPGVMWDASGKDLTRDQVASIPGTVPTVTIGGDTTSGATPVSATSSLLAMAQGTVHGSIGNAAAPELWMFIDPQCSFSVRAMQELTPFIAAGKVRVNVIPLSILDGEDNGQSTRSALSLLSMPSDRLVAAWEGGQTMGPAAADAGTRLQGNMAAAAVIHLQGTPTFIWRKADGTEGRLDGVPPDVGTLIASIGS
jgi:thiol:disulfide interchange protein DsbG